jgi:hypothetical protein
MTWWENQQRWQDMANTLFSSPVAEKWGKTIDMTLIFVKPLDNHFNLRTLAQSGTQVLEMGLLVFPANGANDTAAETYLDSLKKNGVETYRFAIYPNPSGFYGPYTVAYNKNGPPASQGEKWFVYMASYESPDVRTRLQSSDEVRSAFERLTSSMVKEHSDIQVMARTTSQVCCRKTSNSCSLDPDDCKVGIMGGGDTWAGSCGECPQPCMTDYDVCSRVSPRTCSLVGGKRVDACPAAK